MKYPLAIRKIYLPLMIIRKNIEKKVSFTKEIKNKTFCPIFIRKNF